jgi:hypothetical protein
MEAVPTHHSHGQDRNKESFIMKHWLATIFLITQPFCLGAEESSWEEQVFPVQKKILGEVAKGSKIEFSFPVFNPLESQIKIDSISSSCGCTRIETTSISVAPGGQANIRGSIDTVAYSGRRTATLTVRITQPIIHEARLRLEAFIRQDLVLFPASVEFKKAFAGMAQESKTTLMYAGTPSIEIESITSKVPWLTCTHRETFRHEDKSNHEIMVSIDKNAPIGLFREQVMIKTKSPEATTIPLLVVGEVLDRISVSPRSIHLGTVPFGQPQQVNLVIVSRDPATIQSISSADWELEYKLPVSPKRTHLIRVVLVPRIQLVETPTKIESSIIVQATIDETVSIETPITAVLTPN